MWWKDESDNSVSSDRRDPVLQGSITGEVNKGGERNTSESNGEQVQTVLVKPVIVGRFNVRKLHGHFHWWHSYQGWHHQDRQAYPQLQHSRVPASRPEAKSACPYSETQESTHSDLQAFPTQNHSTPLQIDNAAQFRQLLRQAQVGWLSLSLRHRTYLHW